MGKWLKTLLDESAKYETNWKKEIKKVKKSMTPKLNPIKVQVWYNEITNVLGMYCNFWFYNSMGGLEYPIMYKPSNETLKDFGWVYICDIDYDEALAREYKE
jgi:hypothetical protein